MPFSLRGWINEFRENAQVSTKRATAEAIYAMYMGLWLTVTSRLEVGENVLDHEWDLLIILDACRVDALREVQAEYEWLAETEIESRVCVASQSLEFLVKTFTTEYADVIDDITYISANGFVDRAFVHQVYGSNVSMPFGWPKRNVAKESDFDRIEKLWKFHHEDKYACVPPSAPTDEAIVAGRDGAVDKCIVHYIQPHEPHAARAIRDGRAVNDVEREPFKARKRGIISRADLWELYLDNLRGVLDEVEVLLDNFDAEKVLITSDHGESLGEFGIHGHPTGWPHPVVKTVPWAWTTAEDTNETEPEIVRKRTEEMDLEQHLRDLGYR